MVGFFLEAKHRLNVSEYINEKLKDSMNCAELEYSE